MPNWFPYPIRYVGDCGISGRAYSMRGNLAALREVGVTEEQIDIMPWPASMQLQEDWFFDRFLRGDRRRPAFHDYSRRVNIVDVPLQHAGRFWTQGWYNVAVVAWATDRIPADFAELLNRYDEIWAVSQHAAWVLTQVGVKPPIHVIPTALQPKLLETSPKAVAPDIAPELHPYVGPHEFKHTSPVCFYYIGDWSDRKNVDGLLRAYFATEWTDRDPVELLMHCPPRGGRADVVARGEVMKRQLDLLRGARDHAPIVRMLSVPKSYSWVCKLHQMNHVFVTATRGDYFGLPAWEAAAVGNLVVVPEDALDTPPGVLTYWSRLTDVVQGCDRQKWWEPDVEDLTRQFKVAFDLVRSGMTSTDLAMEVRAQLSPEAVGKLLKERMTAIKTELER